MEAISKIILGIVQGITEIIPVSSSGHLILLSELTNINIDLTFLTFLHLMTGMAIIWGFWDEIKYVFSSKQRNHLIKILFIGVIPAVLVGVFIHDYIEEFLYKPSIAIFSLIFFGILMIFVDVFFSNKTNIKKLEDVKVKNSLIIGLSQIIAFLPGASRSGVTIIPAVITGMEKRVAVAFSFLIGLPLILGGFFFQIVRGHTTMSDIFEGENLIGGFTAFVFAYLTILIFKKLLHTNFLTFFGIYRILVGLLMAVLLFI